MVTAKKTAATSTETVTKPVRAKATATAAVPAKKAIAAKPAAAKAPAVGAAAAKKAPAKKAAVKTAAAKAAKPAAAKAAKPLDPAQRAHYVEVAAFYIAERRGFASANTVEDWLEAEAEIDRLIASGHFAK